jgi:hypothetical protein
MSILLVQEKRKTRVVGREGRRREREKEGGGRVKEKGTKENPICWRK